MAQRRFGSRYGSGRNSTALKTLKIAVFAPIPTPQASHLPHKFAALDGVNQQRRSIDGGRSGLHSGQCNRDEHHDEERSHRIRDVAQTPAPEDRRITSNIHIEV